MNSVLLAHSRSTSRAYQRDADCNACGWPFARLDSQRTVRIHCREDVRDPLRNDVPAAQLYIGVVGADSSLPPHLFQPPQAECGLSPLWISWSSQRWYWARMRASLQSYSDTRFRTSLPWEQRRFHSMYPAVRVRWMLSVVFPDEFSRCCRIFFELAPGDEEWPYGPTGPRWTGLRRFRSGHRKPYAPGDLRF